MTISPLAWYCDSAQYANVTAWASNTLTAAGALLRQNTTPTVGNERCFVAIVGGTTTNGSEPTWTVTRGAKTTDNTVTWQECTGHPALNGDLSNTSPWIKNTTPTLGDIITDVAAVHIFICSTAGTTGSSEPSWNTSAVGNTTTDNTAHWTYLGTSFSAWAAPGARLSIVMASGWGVNGNTFFIGDDHAETQSSNFSFPNQSLGTTASPCFAYCVDHTKSVPPSSSADLKTTATITTTTSASISLFPNNGFCYFYGITFQCGSGANAPNFAILNGASGRLKFDTCTLSLPGTAGGAVLGLPGASGIDSNYLELENTTVHFGSAGTIEIGGRLRWRNTASALSGTMPGSSGLINHNSGGSAVFEGVDLSALGSNPIFSNTGVVFNGAFSLIDCKLGSSWSVGGGVNPSANLGCVYELINCDNAGTIYRQGRYMFAGTLLDQEIVVRTGGASDGTTPISWNITTTANSAWIFPFESFPISIWSTLTGANRTVTLYGIWNSANLPNNDDIWIDCAYYGASGSPLASFANSSKANFVAANAANTADTVSAWDSQASARQNSTAYTTASAPIKVADNPGRLFWCTANGTTASSEPAGYASASDGSVITDGTATFRAGVRFSMAVTMSSPQPQLAGYIRTTIKAAKVSSTWYIDPQPVLS